MVHQHPAPGNPCQRGFRKLFICLWPSRNQIFCKPIIQWTSPKLPILHGHSMGGFIGLTFIVSFHIDKYGWQMNYLYGRLSCWSSLTAKLLGWISQILSASHLTLKWNLGYFSNWVTEHFISILKWGRFNGETTQIVPTLLLAGIRLFCW